MKMRILKTALSGICLAAVLLAAGSAKALTYSLDTVWNGTAPTSTAPWLTADFSGSGGTVTLTLTSSLNVSSEFIDAVAFNIDPSILPSSVGLSQNSGPATTTMLHTIDNALSVPGFDGPKGQGWDFVLNWATSSGSGRFDGSDVAVFTLTLGTTLSAADFDYLNDTTLGFLKMSAHVQGIPVAGGGTTSGAVTNGVPDGGSTIALLGFALLGVGALRSKFSRN